MGIACCVASRENSNETVIVRENGSSVNASSANRCNLPQWSYSRRIAVENTSIPLDSDGYQSDTKIVLNRASYDGAVSDDFRRCMSQKLPASVRSPVLDRSISSKKSVHLSLELSKERKSTDLPTASEFSSQNSSRSLTYKAAPQNLSHSPSPTPSPYRAQSKTLSQNISPSLSSIPSSYPEASKPLSQNASPSLPLKSLSPNVSPSLSSLSSLSNSSLPVNSQTCALCLKLLTEKSLWGDPILVESNEVTVLSVLTCDHIYHAECLESLTYETNKYDPACPVCTFGQKKTFKRFKKALKARNKEPRKKVMNRALDMASIVFQRVKTRGHKGPRRPPVVKRE